MRIGLVGAVGELDGEELDAAVDRARKTAAAEALPISSTSAIGVGVGASGPALQLALDVVAIVGTAGPCMHRISSSTS